MRAFRVPMALARNRFMAYATSCLDSGISIVPNDLALANEEVQRFKLIHGRAPQAALRRVLPDAARRELAHTWSGFVALTRNSAPGFGRVRDGLHAACGQNGIGVTKGTIGGILAADLACGRDNPLLADC